MQWGSLARRRSVEVFTVVLFSLVLVAFSLVCVWAQANGSIIVIEKWDYYRVFERPEGYSGFPFIESSSLDFYIKDGREHVAVPSQNREEPYFLSDDGKELFQVFIHLSPLYITGPSMHQDIVPARRSVLDT